MPRSPWPPPARPLTVAPAIGETFMAPACHPEWQRRIRRRAAAARPFPGRQEPGHTRMLFRSCGILPLRSSGLRLTGAQDDRARRQVHAYGGSLLPCSLPIDPPSRSLTIVPPACSLPIFPPSPSPWLPPARLAHHCPSFPARSPLSLLPCSLPIGPPSLLAHHCSSCPLAHHCPSFPARSPLSLLPARSPLALLPHHRGSLLPPSLWLPPSPIPVGALRAAASKPATGVPKIPAMVGGTRRRACSLPLAAPLQSPSIPSHPTVSFHSFSFSLPDLIVNVHHHTATRRKNWRF